MLYSMWDSLCPRPSRSSHPTGDRYWRDVTKRSDPCRRYRRRHPAAPIAGGDVDGTVRDAVQGALEREEVRFAERIGRVHVRGWSNVVSRVDQGVALVSPQRIRRGIWRA